MEFLFKVGFSETTYCNLTNNYPPCSFTKKSYILFNIVEERYYFSILSRSDHSTYRGVEALIYSCFLYLDINYVMICYI